MERKDLHSFFALMGADDDYEGKEIEVYGKTDADDVMDAMEEKIKTLGYKLIECCKTIMEQKARINELEHPEPPKKPYTPPTMKIVNLPTGAQPLLCDSCGNPYWQDNQPEPDDWWGHN